MQQPNLTMFQHLTSFTSFVFVTLNLLLWLPVLLLVALLRLVLPFAPVGQACNRVVDSVYRIAVNIDAWWFAVVLGIEFELEDPAAVMANLEPSQSPVIIANHQTWFDIFLLQTLITSRGPILMFVIKTELLWIPVLGWICLVLNFPRLQRKRDADSRAKDLDRVRSASLMMQQAPGGLLIFPEGTRFSSQKREQSSSLFAHLLPPKPGGFSVIQQSMPPNTQVLDVSIRYSTSDANCWRCMSGAVDRVQVKVSQHQLDDVQDVPDWLRQRWTVKDAWLDGDA